MAIQAELANELEQTGVPVILLGDFNDRDGGVLHGHRQHRPQGRQGGGSPKKGKCKTPVGMRIDWIFASKSTEVVDYVDLENRVTQYITDHRVIYSDISVPVS